MAKVNLGVWSAAMVEGLVVLGAKEADEAEGDVTEDVDIPREGRLSR